MKWPSHSVDDWKLLGIQTIFMFNVLLAVPENHSMFQQFNLIAPSTLEFSTAMNTCCRWLRGYENIRCKLIVQH